jgi:hypothetical protein
MEFLIILFFVLLLSNFGFQAWMKKTSGKTILRKKGKFVISGENESLLLN